MIGGTLIAVGIDLIVLGALLAAWDWSASR
jgi:uncharacterized membrane protein